MKHIMIGKKKFVLQNPYVYAFAIAIAFAIICLVSFFRLSILSSFSPIAYKAADDIDTYYEGGTRYVRCTTEKLYYTGYDQVKHNNVTGHYYYALGNDRCTIYILSADYVGSPNNPPLVLENRVFNAALKKNDNNFKPLLEYMATDLNWNYAGILRHTNTTIVDQKNYNVLTYSLLAVLTFTSIVAIPITAMLAWNHSDYVLKMHHDGHKKHE